MSASCWYRKIQVFSPRRTFGHMFSVASAELPRKLLSLTIRRTRRLSVVEIRLFESRFNCVRALT